ncbi:RHS repeat-associated core domain-containing protein [Tenacibaculum sp. 190524A05c]
MLAYKDYYPFGMPMPNRNVEGEYPYAYQGQEKDQETGMEAFELRLWDARIGRWLTTDPYGQFQSPYLGMGNNPISQIDPDGGFSGPCGGEGQSPCNLGELEEIIINAPKGDGRLQAQGIVFGEFSIEGSLLEIPSLHLQEQIRYLQEHEFYFTTPQLNFFGRVRQNIDNSPLIPKLIGNSIYSTFDNIYAFGSHFSLLNWREGSLPHHIDGTIIVRGSEEGINTGIDGMLSLATFGRLKGASLNGGQFIGKINKIPILGKEIIKRTKLRGKLNKVHNLYQKYIGKRVIGNHFGRVKGWSESVIDFMNGN